jgi:competence protein ComEC
MLAAAAVLAGGIGIGAWSVSGERLAAAAAVLSLMMAAGASSPRNRVYGAVFFLTAGFALGRFRIAMPASAVSAAWVRIDPDRPVRLVGTLGDFWTGPVGRRRTRLLAESITQSGAPMSFPADLSVSAFGEAPLPGVRGDRIALTVSIDAPEDPVSTRDFPVPWRVFRATLKSGWQAEARSRGLASAPGEIGEFFARQLFAAPLPRRTVQEPVAALLLGRTGELDAETADTVRQGGFAHILLATGLHAGIFAAAVAGTLRGLRARRRTRDIALLFAIAAFTLLCGGKPSVTRVALTLGVLLVSRLAELPISPLQAIGASAMTFLVFDPQELWRFGFWLTYVAAVAIALLTRPFVRGLSFLPLRLRFAFAVTFAAQLAAAPLVLWRFNSVQTGTWAFAPLGVALAAALMALGVALLSALVFHLPAAIPAAGFAALFSASEGIAGRLKQVSLLVVTPSFLAVIALLFLVALAAWGGERSRAPALALYGVIFLILAIRHRTGAARRDFSIEALDVGQGDAFLLRSGPSAFLVDGGGAFSGAEDFGRVRLLPKLLDRGVRRLDGVLLSHPHPDHAGGLFSVLRDLRVGAFFHGDGEDEGDFFARLDAAARSAGIATRVLRAGDTVSWAGGKFLVLRSGGTRFKKDPINNESVVLLYVRGSRRVLLTGDAGIPAEQEILGRLGLVPHVDVLKVGHHGSRTSSGADFVAAFAPKAALLSCGRHNRFHHPSPETLATFARRRIPVFRTDLRSDVGILVTPDHLFLRERGRP